jgi:glutamine cyclotransferase
MMRRQRCGLNSFGLIMRIFAALLAVFLFLSPAGCGQEAAPQLTAVIVNEYQHDPAAFTQGLVWDKGAVYESTGLRGRSSLRRVDLTDGRVEQQLDLDSRLFAEGITVFDDRIYQLTWTSGIIFQYDKRSFALRRTFPWPHQGWGITHDGSSLIVSDGSSTLYFLNPDTLTEARQVTVHDGGRQIERLNELEYVDGLIYANVWQECRIALISPADGAVAAWLDLSQICAKMRGGHEDVLNGIMFDQEGGRLFVTGKFWPALFEIRTAPAPASS